MNNLAVLPGVIYAILDPRNNRIRYVGKTCHYKERRRSHRFELKSGKHPNQHLQNWYNGLGGLKPIFKVLQECLPFTIDECEREWIARGRAKGWKLCNLKDGGVGEDYKTPETRRTLSEISKAKWKTPEYQARHEAFRARRAGLSVDQYRARKAHIGGRSVLGPSKAGWERARHVENLEAFKTLTPLTCRGVAFIPCTNGKWAMVDAEDWPRVSQYLWSATQKTNSLIWRAKTNINGRATLLNRFIMRASENVSVPYRNGKQLDCRKANLIDRPVGWSEPLTAEQVVALQRQLAGVERSIEGRSKRHRRPLLLIAMRDGLRRKCSDAIHLGSPRPYAA